MSLKDKLKLFTQSLQLKIHPTQPTEEEKKTFEDISAQDAQKKYETNRQAYIWLDVRTQKEYETNHIPGSKLIPLDELESRIHEVGPKDKKYIVYCHSGGRSVAACQILHENGYKYLYNMPGISHWNGPVE